MVQLARTPLVASPVMEVTVLCPLTFRLVEAEVTVVAPSDPLDRLLPRGIIIATCLKSNVNKASGLVDMIVGRGSRLEAVSRLHLCHHTMGVPISSIGRREASVPCKVFPYHEIILFRTIP
jgi:hypothetical protein